MMQRGDGSHIVIQAFLYFTMCIIIVFMQTGSRSSSSGQLTLKSKIRPSNARPTSPQLTGPGTTRGGALRGGRHLSACRRYMRETGELVVCVRRTMCGFVCMCGARGSDHAYHHMAGAAASTACASWTRPTRTWCSPAWAAGAGGTTKKTRTATRVWLGWWPLSLRIRRCCRCKCGPATGRRTTWLRGSSRCASHTCISSAS